MHHACRVVQKIKDTAVTWFNRQKAIGIMENRQDISFGYPACFHNMMILPSVVQCGLLLFFLGGAGGSIRVPFFEYSAEVGREVAFELHALSCRGVIETETACVQCMARHDGETVLDELFVFGKRGAFQYPVAAVPFVVEQRVSYIFHVDAYLVRSPCFETALYKCDVAVTFQYAVMCDGVFTVAPVREYGHFETVAHATAYVARDGTFVLLEVTPYECDVTSGNSMFEKLSRQSRVGFFVLGYDEQSRCVLVYAVHQSGAHVPFLKQRSVFKVPRQRVDERAAVVAVAGVYDESGRLVYYQQIVVFVWYVERYVFRNDFHLPFWVGHDYGDAVERLYLVARLDRYAVHEYVAAVGCGLHPAARTVFQPDGQVFVYAQHGLSAVYGHGEVFVQVVLLLFLFFQLFRQFVYTVFIHACVGVICRFTYRWRGYICCLFDGKWRFIRGKIRRE